MQLPEFDEVTKRAALISDTLVLSAASVEQYHELAIASADVDLESYADDAPGFVYDGFAESADDGYSTTTIK